MSYIDRFPEPRMIQHDGFDLALYEAGPSDGMPIILVHGWPELAMSWAAIMPKLTQAGYRVVAPDMRGYGRSSAPSEPAHYGIAQIVSDIEAILDDIGAQKAVLCGHDWGGIIVWHAARMLQHRVSHVISLCTPHVRPAPANPVEIFRQRYGDAHYFVHFNDHEGMAAQQFAADPEAFFRFMFRCVPPHAVFTPELTHIPKRFAQFLAKGMPQSSGEVLSDKLLDYYVTAYSRSGFHGGINYYRNTQANWCLTKDLSVHVKQPVLMISAAQDLFLPPALTESMPDYIDNLERHTIAGAGHWLLWEAPDMTAHILINWLSRQELSKALSKGEPKPSE